MSMKRTRRLNALGRYGIILCWMLFTLLPIYTAFVASLTEYQNLGKSFLYPTDWAWHNSVSYTHLTLPTKLEV